MYLYNARIGGQWMRSDEVLRVMEALNTDAAHLVIADIKQLQEHGCRYCNQDCEILFRAGSLMNKHGVGPFTGNDD